MARAIMRDNIFTHNGEYDLRAGEPVSVSFLGVRYLPFYRRDVALYLAIPTDGRHTGCQITAQNVTEPDSLPTATPSGKRRFIAYQADRKGYVWYASDLPGHLAKDGRTHPKADWGHADKRHALPLTGAQLVAYVAYYRDLGQHVSYRPAAEFRADHGGC